MDKLSYLFARDPRVLMTANRGRKFMETPAGYNVETSIRPECLQAYAHGWVQPTPSEVRAVLQIAGLSGAEAARLVGMSDSRVIRRWTSGESKIHYSPWAVLCETAGFGRIWTFTATLM